MKNILWATTLLAWSAGLRAQSALFQPGYTNIVSVAVSPDGKTMAVEGESSEVSLWDLTLRKKTMTLKRMPKPAKTDADDETPDMSATLGFAVPEYSTTFFSATGENYIIGNSAGVTAWNVKISKPTLQLWASPDHYDISLDGRNIVVVKSALVSHDDSPHPAEIAHQVKRTLIDTLLLYTVANGQVKSIQVESPSKSKRVRFVPGTNSILVIGMNGDLTLIDAESGKTTTPMQVYDSDEEEIVGEFGAAMSMFVNRSVAVHPQKKLIAVSDGQQHLFIFDFKENRLKTTIQLPASIMPGMDFEYLQFTPNGAYLFGVQLVASDNGFMKSLVFWNVESRAQSKKMDIEAIWSAYNFSPDGKWFALCQAQRPKMSTGSISIFDAASLEEVESFSGKGALNFFSNDTHRLAYRADHGMGTYLIKH